MFKNIKIGSKITAVMLVMVLIAVVAVSYISYSYSRRAIEDQFVEKLALVTSLKVSKVESFFKDRIAAVNLIKSNESIQESLDLLDTLESLDAENVKIVLQDVASRELGLFVENFDFNRILIVGPTGEIWYNSKGEGEQYFADSDPSGQTLEKASQGVYVGSHFYNEGHSLLLSTSLTGLISAQSATLVAQLSLDSLFADIQDTTNLGDTGETLFGALQDNKVNFITELRHSRNESFDVALGERRAKPVQKALQGETGVSILQDYRGEEVLASWQPVPIVGWGAVSKIDTAEIYRGINNLIYNFLISGIIVVIVALMIGILFSRFLVSPLLTLTQTMNLLRKGVLPSKVDKKSSDEFGTMSEIVNNLVQSLKRTANFAHQIGQGNFEADFQPLSDQDTLGNSLINMRDSIQDAEKKDKERNWIVSGVAEIGEILRTNDNLEQLGDEILAFVTQKIQAIQGAFYVMNDDDDRDKFIEMKASYAYKKKKYLSGNFKITERYAEGLVGQAAIEQDIVLRTEIPDDYVTITSGILGDQKPKSILVVPLITDEQVYGVLEFASFDKFSSSQVKFVQEISLIIARTIFNIKVNARTRNLLEESQKMSNELQEQQEILRQNAEEMAATQEELQRTNSRLEDQIEEVNRTQKRTQLLLENASEVITIYEKDGTIRYISPSVERILGYTQNEMTAINDIKYVQEEDAEDVKNMFKQLIAKPHEAVTLQYEYKRKDGDTIWLEATGSNHLDDPAIQGILLNSRDITEKRRAEQEERMRSKMQALSENSPDLITRFDKEGQFFYINPTISNYTGNDPEFYLRKKIQEVELANPIVDEWMKILGKVDQSNAKISTEMDFPSAQGDRVMQVNAIPEFDEQEALESILVVSHDITERKQIEIEIQSKNRKITESINYAKRIQGSILPDNSVINKRLPNSFILYKARDVVSGDFPWYLEVGDDIYIAAVDCTGHGVPGALISLIGYFLLNDIVRSRKIEDVGIILDQLDEGVTATLRQDREDATTKDGMDIALCKINLKKGSLDYAGAHRPLYVIKDGEMEEIKGNKFPIGGGRYRNQTNFTKSTVQLSTGDSVFFCSDGFPDQFGGENNRKFGPKRLRELLMANKEKDAHDMHSVLDQEWENWKGDHRQTDDVLLIGIKF